MSRLCYRVRDQHTHSEHGGSACHAASGHCKRYAALVGFAEHCDVTQAAGIIFLAAVAGALPISCRQQPGVSHRSCCRPDAVEAGDEARLPTGSDATLTKTMGMRACQLRFTRPARRRPSAATMNAGSRSRTKSAGEDRQRSLQALGRHTASRSATILRLRHSLGFVQAVGRKAAIELA